ncbi:MAG: response regulator transcription factor [Chitinophagaceae bacterium]|nr:response regulator transcription factor [Chitinophagaceae bacterium]
MEIKCLIIDSDAFARETIKGYIEKFSFLTLIGSFECPLQTMDLLNSQTVDLVFSDTQMPEMNGTSFLKALKNPPYVIFVTAHTCYAIEAFELDVVDYILKPYTFERFLKAINKAKKMIGLSNNKINLQKDFMTIKDRHRTLLVKFINIYYVEGMKDYVRIITDEEQIISQCTMKEMESLLPASKFVRLQKSYIVNLDYIKSVDATKATLKRSSIEIPIGLQYRNEVYKKLEID